MADIFQAYDCDSDEPSVQWQVMERLNNTFYYHAAYFPTEEAAIAYAEGECETTGRAFVVYRIATELVKRCMP